MTHNLPQLVQFIGAVVGGLGVCVALYLQFARRNESPPLVVVGFFVYGASLLLATLPAYGLGRLPSSVASTAAVLAFSSLEIVAVFVVFRHYDISIPAADAIMKSLGPRL